MQRHFKRLGLAFAVSLLGFAATLTWYYAGQTRRHADDGRDAVAKLTESSDEVQRKESTRVIWETVGLNDDLFTGEAIRTSAHASAQIRLKSGAVIHLDPDSLVVLEQNANGLSLDFLEGNLFVQGAGDASGITLKTGKGEIAVTGADLSLSKGARGDVDLEVFRGSAQLSQGDRRTAVGADRAATLSAGGVSERGDGLKLLAPRAGETVSLNLAGGEKLALKWTPLPAGYVVSIELGTARGSLKAQTLTYPGDAGHADVTLAPGKWVLRLRARGQGQPELASLMTPFTLTPRAAPALIEPTAESPILKSSPEQTTKFRWLDRNPFVAQTLEVAADARFTKVVEKRDLDGAVDQVEVNLGEGVYFWRVTGFAGPARAGLASAATRIRVIAAADGRALPTAPVDHARLGAADVRANGLTLKWHSPTAQMLPVEIRDARGAVAFAGESRDGFVRASDLPPGTYRWTVGRAPSASEPFEFTIAETPRLAWANEDAVAEYAGAAPTLDAGWMPFEKAAAYRYRFAAEADALDAVPWRTVRGETVHAAVPADGAYRVAVEAVDERGAVLAATTERHLAVRARPPLGAPAWPVGVTGFKSDARGNVTLNWNAVEGARGYAVLIEDQAGVVTEKTVSRGPASLSRLRPGTYKVRVKSVDQFARPGDPGDARTLDVPNASDIRAPKIRAMKVR